MKLFKISLLFLVSFSLTACYGGASNEGNSNSPKKQGRDGTSTSESLDKLTYSKFYLARKIGDTLNNKPVVHHKITNLVLKDNIRVTRSEHWSTLPFKPAKNTVSQFTLNITFYAQTKIYHLPRLLTN